MPTKEELRRMAEIDVREVDPNSLKNLEDVQIDTSLPRRERAADYIRQIGNPYCYISHGGSRKDFLLREAEHGGMPVFLSFHGKLI